MANFRQHFIPHRAFTVPSWQKKAWVANFVRDSVLGTAIDAGYPPEAFGYRDEQSGLHPPNCTIVSHFYRSGRLRSNPCIHTNPRRLHSPTNPYLIKPISCRGRYTTIGTRRREIHRGQENNLHQQAGCKTAIDFFLQRFSLGKRAVSM